LAYHNIGQYQRNPGEIMTKHGQVLKDAGFLPVLLKLP
jgi:hypothetical protein